MTLKPILAAGAALVLLAGCTDPQTGELDRTRTGMGTGAALGALLGSQVAGDRTMGAIVGGGAGAIAGAAIGQRLDRQAAELRDQLGDDVIIRRSGNDIILTMPQDILFAFDSADLRPDLQSDLRSIGASLQRYPDTRVIVTGHTDSTGDASYNQRLSERRAQSVAAVLTNSGVSSGRIVTRGAGQTQPIASNATAEGRAQNRRVDIVIRAEGE
ncbi:MAG: OmpA family protein [Pararhodobacter sp.]|nr:OmpA family protein [Pararhodobacter sp.]